MSQPHHNLVAWQRADDLFLLVHKLTRELPQEERFGLAPQLRRAAYSVSANIVEGYAYEAPNMRLKHLRIAIGSLAELGYGIHVVGRLGYVSPSRLSEIETTIHRTAAPLHGLVAHWKRELSSHKPR